MRVHVGSSNPVKREAVRRVFARAFSDARPEVHLVDVASWLSRVPEQPFDDQVPRGAVARARTALEDADYGVGIEAGLMWSAALETYLDVQYCAIVDPTGRVTAGHGPGFVYPERVIQEVRAGRTVGQAMEAWTGIHDIGRRMGAIGYLSNGLIDRTELTEQAVLMALLPRIRPQLYRPPG